MTDPTIRTRLTFYIGGYDPKPPVIEHGRFARELRRFERTWSATASVSEISIENDQAAWKIAASGSNWQVETQFRLVRWDDVTANDSRRPVWKRIPLGFLAFADFVAGGAFWGYARISWRYTLFFVYPFVIFAALTALAWIAGAFVQQVTESMLTGIVTAATILMVLYIGASHWFHLSLIFDDWIFSRDYIYNSDPVLDRRLDFFAREIVAAARANEADEILVFGHSLGAVLGVDLIDRVLRFAPDFGRIGTRVAFVTTGSSILKIGLHRRATSFHAALARVATASRPFWAEYQSSADWLNFFDTDPVAESGLMATGRPVVRNARISTMVDPNTYRRLRPKIYRMHCQVISGNERRAAYDYFMLLCGPLSAEHQFRLPFGAASVIGEDGALRVAQQQRNADQL
jgi:hypothetical protein